MYRLELQGYVPIAHDFELRHIFRYCWHALACQWSWNVCTTHNNTHHESGWGVHVIGVPFS